MAVTKEEARQEQAQRELARRNMADYTRYMLPEQMARAMQPFHELTCELLEQVLLHITTQGKEGIGRLMIFMPPGYWKSLLVSRLFPSFGLGKFPDMNVITSSYSSKMAFKNSRNCRDFVVSQKFSAVFGDLSSYAGSVEMVEMSENVKAVEEWRLSNPHRGGSWAAGVNGSVTGERAHLFIIDDPFKDRKEAESQGARDDLWDWMNDVVKTRLEIGGAIVIPQTRWHPDGISGRLLKDMADNPQADQWTVLSLMAMWEPSKTPEGMGFEEYHLLKLQDGVWVDQKDPMGRQPGEALWPLKQNEKELQALRSVNPYGFESLYQQQPYLRSGDFFEREWFEIVNKLPPEEDVLHRIRCWDKAGSKSGKGDYTTGALLSVTKDDFVHVEHMARQRGTPKMRNDLIRSTAIADKKRKGPKIVVWHQQDPGTSGLESAQATNRMLAKEGITGRFETVTGDKEVRAGPWSTAVQGGMAFLVRGGWNRAFIDEHAAFPGTYDDQVDITSWGFNKLMEMVNKPKRESRIW